MRGVRLTEGDIPVEHTEEVPPKAMQDCVYTDVKLNLTVTVVIRRRHGNGRHGTLKEYSAHNDLFVNNLQIMKEERLHRAY